ncbi:MAG: UDP-N-acetylmuramoyl-L-alanine--D-glutamate ligase [Bacteroidetes bacterium]|nr:UDP-N-acetylmuramoyl-L-alanine--D-glutamate ligase [Bacteroidota bacterium]
MRKRLVILGAGESGTGAAVLGCAQNWDVFVSDKGKIAQKYQDELNLHNIAWEQEQHSKDKILSADLIIKSPGIPDKAPMVAAALEKGIEVIDELEFGYRYTQAKMISITGTNGKTTTTLLIYHLLKQAGLNVGLAGNIGRSLARQVAQEQFDYYVVEMSSFQLDRIDTYRSHIAILCNITPDHLDRYEYNVEAYADAKMRITRNQEASEYFIYCADDSLTQEAMLRNPFLAKAIPFSLQTTLTEGAYGKDNILHILTKETFTLDMQEFTLRGQHNAYNSMAASVAASLMDVRKDSIRESFTNFQNAEHRLEFVQKVGGIDYINDSKATNVNSAWYALESMDRPVIWIAGGVDKGNNYADLKNLVKSKVKMIICLGLDNIKIHQAFQADVDLIINTSSAKEAVHVASKMADQGDVVLLSPACASFDLFDSYEDRGRQFKEAVRHL